MDEEDIIELKDKIHELNQLKEIYEKVLELMAVQKRKEQNPEEDKPNG